MSTSSPQTRVSDPASLINRLGMSSTVAALLREIIDSEEEFQDFLRCRLERTPQGPKAQVHVRTADGQPMLVRTGSTDGLVFEDVFIARYHEPPRPLRDGAVVLDLGAYVGYSAAHLACVARDVRVIAVELDEANAEMARRNLAAFGERVTLLRGAVWDVSGEIEYATKGLNSQWGFRVEALGSHPQAVTTCGKAPAFTVDELCSRFGLTTIDYAKVDVEGAEDRIIKADAPWLRITRAIKVEIHPPATRESIARELELAGFEVIPDRKQIKCLIGIRPD
jgi:FkbM family methyltransferase